MRLWRDAFEYHSGSVRGTVLRVGDLARAATGHRACVRREHEEPVRGRPLHPDNAFLRRGLFDEWNGYAVVGWCGHVLYNHFSNSATDEEPRLDDLLVCFLSTLLLGYSLSTPIAQGFIKILNIPKLLSGLT